MATARHVNRLDQLTCVMLMAFALCTAEAARPTKARRESSCYEFDLATRAGSTFLGVKGQLRNNGVVSGSTLYGVVHACFNGTLAPRNTSAISSVRYFLDDPARRRAPIGFVKSTAPFKLNTAGPAPGSHRVTAVITFGRFPGYKTLVVTRSFRVPTPKPSKRAAIKRYGQCGGAGAMCGGMGKPCIDAQWPGTRCAGAGFHCIRLDKYYQQCRNQPFTR